MSLSALPYLLQSAGLTVRAATPTQSQATSHAVGEGRPEGDMVLEPEGLPSPTAGNGRRCIELGSEEREGGRVLEPEGLPSPTANGQFGWNFAATGGGART